MITLIPSVLDAEMVRTVQTDLADLDTEGGHSSCRDVSTGRLERDGAGRLAAGGGEDRRELRRQIACSLLSDQRFVRAALPRRLVGLAFDRCEPGMGRHAHVDAPLIDGCRTDLSFTLFLSDPGDYDRGDLIIETSAGWESRRHAAGDLLLYPARYAHSVAPVTRGTRLVAVGWVESLTPSAERREVLGDLDAALSLLDEPCCDADARLRIENVRANLVRLWLNGDA